MEMTEIEEILTKKIEYHKRMMELYQTILNIISGNINGWKPGERPEELRVGRKKIGIIYIGEDYVRAVPLFEMPVIDEIQIYLKQMENEIRELQARITERTGDEMPLAKIEIISNSTVKEIKISNVFSAVEKLKAKAVLKHILEVGYEYYKLKKG